MPNLHIRYKSAERKIAQKNSEYMLGLIWFSGFRGEDLNVIFYQNMPNLHNRYISAERKISSPLFLFLAWWPSWLEVGITGHTLVQIGPVASEELIKM